MPLHGHKAQVIPVFFTPDSTRIVTSGFDLTTRVWDAVHGDELLTLKGIMASDISPDGLRLCTAGFPPVQIWEIASREQVQKWQLEENPHQP